MKHPEQHQSQWRIPFFSIWTGQQLSLIGSQVAQFALVWWLTQTTGSATMLATATLVALLPQVLLGPFAGALVDRWNRRRVMVVADSLIALVSAWLAYLFWTGAMRPWHVYIIMLARAMGGSFHWPAMTASTSLMVPGEHLTRVAGVNQTTQGARDIVSPPLGALLLSLLPLHVIMAIDVVTAAFGILPLLFVRIPQPERTVTAGGRPSLWGEVREGLRYMWNWPGLLAMLILATVINFLLNPAFSLLPILITKHFGGQALQLGWMNSAWGIGVVFGGLTLSVRGGFRRRITTTLSGLSGMGLGTLLIGLSPATAFPLALGAIFIAGFMNPITNGPVHALFQTVVAPEMQGRVFTLIGSACAAMSPLGLAIAGPVADALGVQVWFTMGGAVCISMALSSLFLPAIMHLEDNHGADRVVTREAPVPASVTAGATE